MDAQNVEVVILAPMRVASAWGFGTSPEYLAWAMLESWARPLGLLDAAGARVFGFNNPNPSEDSPNYGYEFMVTVGPDVAPGEGIRIGELRGGRYAMMPATVETDPGVDIPAAWQRLDAWVSENGHKMGHYQWLEEMDGAGKLKALLYAIQ